MKKWDIPIKVCGIPNHALDSLIDEFVEFLNSKGLKAEIGIAEESEESEE